MGESPPACWSDHGPPAPLTLPPRASCPLRRQRGPGPPAPVSGGTIVAGRGPRATPGRTQRILPGPGGGVTRANCPTLRLMPGGRAFRTAACAEREGRARWPPRPAAGVITRSGGTGGAAVIAVRPRAGARIWSHRKADDRNPGPGPLVRRGPRAGQRVGPGRRVDPVTRPGHAAAD